uniref:Uncharacterized protein n=1 Tax=uncultured bacterium Contig1777 TaxID=1393514 RepID=W0FQK7_9BACT|nr:hypothetical protein [uncultured bacterium Contig1777]
MYEARKHSIGENQHTMSRVDQNDPPTEKPKSTAEAIAKELGVGKETIKRSGHFAQGIDMTSFSI